MFSSDEISSIVNKDVSNSILDEYDKFLAINGIYRSYDTETNKKNLRGRRELTTGIINLLSKAKLDNEKLELFRALYTVGYDKDLLVEMIISQLQNEPTVLYVWEYCDLLYEIRNFKYITEYISIIENPIYGSGRQMLISLLGKSKKPQVIPVLHKLLADEKLCGHVIDALKHFKSEEVFEIMKMYQDYTVKWVRNIARDYVKKY